MVRVLFDLIWTSPICLVRVETSPGSNAVFAWTGVIIPVPESWRSWDLYILFFCNREYRRENRECVNIVTLVETQSCRICCKNLHIEEFLSTYLQHRRKSHWRVKVGIIGWTMVNLVFICDCCMFDFLFLSGIFSNSKIIKTGNPQREEYW